MRTIHLAVVVAVCLTASAGAAESLRLVDALREALVHNDLLNDARDSERQADGGVRLAEAVFTPTLTPNVAGALGNSTLSNQSYGLGFAQLTPIGTQVLGNVSAVSARNQLGTFFASDTSLTLRQPLLRGFGREAIARDLAVARLSVAGATRHRELVEQQLTVDVATAYYRVSTQAQLIEVANRALERAHNLLDASREKLKIGRVSRLDVLRAQQLASQAELQASDAQAGVEDAKDQLRVLMGRGPDYDFTVTTDIPVARENTLSLDVALATANERRPDIKAATDSVQQAQLALAAVVDQNLPQFDLSLSLTRQDSSSTLGTAFGLDRFHVATLAAVSMPLINRTPQTVAQENAALEIGRRRRMLDDTKRRAAQQVRQAFRQQERLFKTLEQAEAAVGFAEEEADLAALRFQRGLSNNLDVVSAEANLFAVRARRFGAMADVAVSRLQIRAAVGVLDPGRDVQ